MCETLVQFNLYIVLNSNIELFSTMKVFFNAAQAPVTALSWLSAAGQQFTWRLALQRCIGWIDHYSFALR
mgnify:CR=1 FL=1